MVDHLFLLRNNLARVWRSLDSALSHSSLNRVSPSFPLEIFKLYSALLTLLNLLGSPTGTAFWQFMEGHNARAPAGKPSLSTHPPGPTEAGKLVEEVGQGGGRVE